MMLHPELPLGAFIAAVLVLVPLPAHWRSRNVATVSILAWLFVMDLTYGVNTIVWDGNVFKHLLVWCDITTKLSIGASVALPAATMCVCRNLELVASGRIARLTLDDKRRKMFFDLGMCYGLPVITMVLHYIVQGHRFDILEYVGCLPATYYSIPGVFIIWFPPLLLSALTAIYATLALHHFFRQRVTFTMQLQNSNSALSTGRYLRLVAMSILQIVWQTTLTAIAMYDNISPGLRPWTNWADVHSNFGRIDTIPMLFVPVSMQRQFFLFLWVMPVSSYIFFIFFGFGEEAIKDYKKTATWILEKIFRKRPDSKTLVGGGLFRSPKSALSPIKVNSTYDLNDDQSLPAYSPATDRSYDLTTKEKIGQKIANAPYEPPSPSFATETSRSRYTGGSFSSTASAPWVEISDEYLPPSPPAPLIPLPVPAYHRPFSPPTVCPVSSRDCDVTLTSLRTHTEVERMV